MEDLSDNILPHRSIARTPQDAAQAARLAKIFLTGGEKPPQRSDPRLVGDGGDAAINAEARRSPRSSICSKIDGEDQVMLKVNIAEVNRQVLKQLGVQFEASAASSGAAFVELQPGQVSGQKSCRQD